MAVAVAVVGVGSALANSSLTDTRSSSSLEMMTGEVPPGKRTSDGSQSSAYDVALPPTDSASDLRS
jgi:hypothetical protein